MKLINLDGSFVQPQAILTIKPSRRWGRIGPQEPDDLYGEKGMGYIPFIDILLVGDQRVHIDFSDEESRDVRLAEIVAEMEAA